MGVVKRDDGWRLPDELWEQMEPLLPPRKPHPLGCHNPRVPDRSAMNAIFSCCALGVSGTPSTRLGYVRAPRLIVDSGSGSRQAYLNSSGVSDCWRRRPWMKSIGHGCRWTAP